MSEIYWSNVCLASIKSNKPSTFEYGLSFIDDADRKKRLREIKKLYESNDPDTRKIVDVQYTHTIPVIIS